MLKFCFSPHVGAISLRRWLMLYFRTRATTRSDGRFIRLSRALSSARAKGASLAGMNFASATASRLRVRSGREGCSHRLTTAAYVGVAFGSDFTLSHPRCVLVGSSRSDIRTYAMAWALVRIKHVLKVFGRRADVDLQFDHHD
jgi:hypothetical protein